MERYYSKYLIEKVQGIITAPVKDIKKGCLLNNKKVDKNHSEEGVFLTKDEALKAFKDFVSNYYSYSRNVHFVIEYELMEVVYEVLDEEDEYPVDYKTIAYSDFDDEQHWQFQKEMETERGLRLTSQIVLFPKIGKFNFGKQTLEN